MTALTVAGRLDQARTSRFVIAGAVAPALQSVRGCRFRALPGLIEVHADPAGFRPLQDTNGRSLHLHGGAALFNLRLAAAQIGIEPVVRLMPDRHHPTLLASVRLAGPHKVVRSERLLYAASLRPLPARQPYGDQRPPLPVLNELIEVARLEGVALHCLPQSGGPQAAVLTTRGDSPAEWLRAGQALQSVLLSSAVRAVSTSFLHEVVTLPGAREAMQPGEIPQVVLQLARTGL
ncbi:MAG: hypothetical protein ABIS86_01930 [Streptosporangiaceae bacterium]